MRVAIGLVAALAANSGCVKVVHAILLTAICAQIMIETGLIPFSTVRSVVIASVRHAFHLSVLSLTRFVLRAAQ